MEDVHYFPRDSNQAAFSFGWNAGGIASFFESLGYTVDFLVSKVWQSRLLHPILPKLDTKDVTRKQALKLASRTFVKEIYPQVNLVPNRGRVEHDGMSDAICIAHFGKLNG